MRLLAPGLLVAWVMALAAVILPPVLGGSRSTAQARASEAPAETPVPARERKPRSVTIGWVGDTVLGSRHGIPPEGGRALLREVRPLLLRPDVMIGNLEGVIGVGGTAKCAMGTPHCFAFQASPEAAGTLAWAGFDVMNVANNHANDYGPAGLSETIGHLTAAGVDHTGRPDQITVVRRRGVDVAVVGFAAYPWSARIEDPDAAAELVRRARSQADLVIVVMHAGAEGTDQIHTPVGEEFAYGEARGDTRAFAHAVIDAGAHAVFGSGPHVVRGVERRRGRPIVYSTGNFAGFHTFPTTGTLALASAVAVQLDEEGRLLRGTWIPLRLAGPGQPRVDPEGASTALAARLSQEDFREPGLAPDGELVTAGGTR